MPRVMERRSSWVRALRPSAHRLAINSEQALPQVALFAEQFFGIISLDELTQRRMSDLAGCTLSAWRLLERFDPAQPQVRVFHPDYERHGWQYTHTAVEVLQHDLPFLVD